MTTSNLEQKTVEIIDQLQQGISKVGEVLYKATPQAIDTILVVKQVSGVQHIIIGLFLLVLGLTVTIKARKKFMITYSDDMKFLLGMVIIIFGISPLIPSVILLLNIWNWVAIFNPKLAVAHDLLTEVIIRVN